MWALLLPLAGRRWRCRPALGSALGARAAHAAAPGGGEGSHTAGQPPAEPSPEDCCGKGCVECVWTLYWAELQRYNADQAQARGELPPVDPFEALELRLGAEAAAREGEPRS